MATNSKRLELEEENNKLIEANKYFTGEVKAAEMKYIHVRINNIDMINTMMRNFQGKLGQLELIISKKNREIEDLKAEKLAHKDTDSEVSEAPDMVEADEVTDNTTIHRNTEGDPDPYTGTTDLLQVWQEIW